MTSGEGYDREVLAAHREPIACQVSLRESQIERVPIVEMLEHIVAAAKFVVGIREAICADQCGNPSLLRFAGSIAVSEVVYSRLQQSECANSRAANNQY
nr:hypothetical protein CFP56_79377 [Quercus suber]